MLHAKVIAPCLLMICVAGCHQEEEVVESLELSGGTISRGLDGRPRAIRFDDGSPSNADLAIIKGVTSLQEIYADAPNAGDEEFAVFANMPSLSVLSLTSTKATGKSIASLAASKSLTHLDISGASDLTDDDLKPLSAHAHLRVLKLSEILLTDAIADVIVTLPKLEELSLDGTEITHVTIRRLAEQSPGLKSLSMGSALITDDVIPLIARFKDLETLEITRSAITGASMAAWSDLAKLKLIRLTDCASVTNEAVMDLADVALLFHLDVSGTQFTAIGLNQKGFASLNVLEADRTGVTDDAIAQFKGLPVLYSVTLRGTAVTLPGVRNHFAGNDQTAITVGE
ncbi:MAG: hypothetical protein GY903_30250 [Fuerstiella sp.]|nr:hypothetical protein [Fuerstiella sp.]MCP4858776.1 hypothetical protein [Fuerstiella sp.]